MAKPERPKRRMLLVASIGVASVSYVAACEQPHTGNVAQPPDRTIDSGAVSPVSGNLPAPMPPADASAATDTADAGYDPVAEWEKGSPVAGNLMAHTPASASATAKPTPPKLRPPKPNPVGGNLAPPSSQ